ncbi:MAG TPA: hypothetical protein VFG00_04385 [Acidothermaceae bacterium]|nr:hypothetical protein [Acidothermaceae bacterium]
MRRRIMLVATATALLAVLLLAVPLGIFVGHSYVNDERLELQRAAATAAASLRGDRPTVGSLGIDRSEIVASVYDRSGRLIDGAGPANAGRWYEKRFAGPKPLDPSERASPSPPPCRMAIR